MSINNSVNGKHSAIWPRLLKCKLPSIQIYPKYNLFFAILGYELYHLSHSIHPNGWVLRAYFFESRLASNLLSSCLWYAGITDVHPRSRTTRHYYVFKWNICFGCGMKVTMLLSCYGQFTVQCEDSGVFKRFIGSYQILLFTLFVVLASTAFIVLGKESLCSAWTFDLQSAFLVHKLNEDEN
jgi:hypothetical protein